VGIIVLGVALRGSTSPGVSSVLPLRFPAPNPRHTGVAMNTSQARATLALVARAALGRLQSTADLTQIVVVVRHALKVTDGSTCLMVDVLAPTNMPHPSRPLLAPLPRSSRPRPPNGTGVGPVAYACAACTARAVRVGATRDVSFVNSVRLARVEAWTRVRLPAAAGTA